MKTWTFNATGSGRIGTIQQWIVPISGMYRIEARGAKGGDRPGYWSGGKGAYMSGDFVLAKGQVLKILVGQVGIPSRSSNAGAGGGGGTFVVNNNVPLLIAGGGGGAARASTYGHGPGGDAPVTNDGDKAGNMCGSYGNGCGASFSQNGSNAFSFLQGGGGGTDSWNEGAEGGFGGGAGASGHLGGGGGGYTGGNGGTLGNSTIPLSGIRSTGGGSYNAGINQANESGVNSGDGSVVITLSRSYFKSLTFKFKVSSFRARIIDILRGVLSYDPIEIKGELMDGYDTLQLVAPVRTRNGFILPSLIFGKLQYFSDIVPDDMFDTIIQIDDWQGHEGVAYEYKAGMLTERVEISDVVEDPFDSAMQIDDRRYRLGVIMHSVAGVYKEQLYITDGICDCEFDDSFILDDRQNQQGIALPSLKAGEYSRYTTLIMWWM